MSISMPMATLQGQSTGLKAFWRVYQNLSKTLINSQSDLIEIAEYNKITVIRPTELKVCSRQELRMFLHACGQETERRGLQAVRKQSMNMQDLTTLQEPAVKVNDRREGQLLLHSPLQVICHLAHQPPLRLFFLHKPPSLQQTPADGCSTRSHFDGMWFAAGAFPPASH